MPDARCARVSTVARDLAEVIGEDGLARLVGRWGGARLKVHCRFDPSSELARVLGPGAYAALHATYHGEPIDVPLLGTGARTVPEAEILSHLHAGLSADVIAPRYRITRRRVFRILSRSAPTTP